MTSKEIFVFGYGYTGKFITDAFLKANYSDTFLNTNYSISATSNKWFPHIRMYDFRDPNAHKSIASRAEICDAIIVTIPPVKGEDVVFNFLKTHQIKPKQIIYCSSTGLYADQNGHWVTEKSPLCLDSEISKTRYQIEQKWSTEYDAVILRLSGIYGPDRNLISRFLKAPIKILKDKKEHLFNRIHVEDIANIIVKLVEKNITNEIFNLADQMPTPLMQVLDFIFDEMRLDRAKHIEEVSFSDLSPMMQYFYASNKRISNQKMIDTLHYRFIYPDYKKGFKHIIAKKQYG